MIIATIVGVDKNNAIGKNNDMPWHLPADLKYFKRQTMGCPIIMGRKCYESIGRPLPGRLNLVLSKNKAYEAPGCTVVHSLEEALDLAKQSKPEKCFIIGGGVVYKLGLKLSTELYITSIDTAVEDADVFFEWTPAHWVLKANEAHLKDEKNSYAYSFMQYERIKKN